MGVIKKFPSLEAHFLADAGLPAPSPAALSGGLRCFLRPSRHTSPWTSRRGSDQVPHTHQIVGGRCPGKHPGDTLPAPVPHLAHQSYRLHPPKDFFHPFAFLLTERVAGMARGSLVDGAAAVRIVLGHMRRGAARPHLLHPVRGVVILVGAHRDAPRSGAGLHHLQRRLAFRRRPPSPTARATGTAPGDPTQLRHTPPADPAPTPRPRPPPPAGGGPGRGAASPGTGGGPRRVLWGGVALAALRWTARTAP